MIKYIILDSFKGQTHAEINFSEFVTAICGPNGSGKSTVFDAHNYLWFNKDSKLQTNPEIHPDFMKESEPSVCEIHDIDGKEYVFRKYQVDLRTKKQKQEGAPVRIANKFEINNVPKTEKDFFKEVAELGIDVDKMLYFEVPDAVLMLNTKDRRSFVFALAGDVTDYEVAKTIPDCHEARELMEQGKKSDEIIATAKVTIKRENEVIEAVPNQIIGMEKSKVAIDPALEQRFAELEKLIADKTAERDEYQSKASTASYDAQLRELENDRTALYNKANTERLSKLSEAQWSADKAGEAYREAQRELDSITAHGNNLNNGFRAQTETKKRLISGLKNLQEQTFSIDTVCPTCGQNIPAERIESAKMRWTQDREKQIADITSRINAAQTLVDGYMKEGKELAAKRKAAEQKVADANQALYGAREEVGLYSTSIQPDYTEVDSKIEAVKAERSAAASYSEMVNGAQTEINAAKQELAEIIKRRGQESNNERIDSQIAELKERQQKAIQNKADAENILYQMQLISQRKNELLSDAVNSHFTRVKWRLFITQKNGEVKDDCTPMVLCYDGKYRDMTFGANTAAIQAAKLDICVGLQKFYGQNLPIWLDGAECFDEKNRAELASMGAQMILLCVENGEGLVVR